MSFKISDLIIITRQKNGRVRINHGISNESKMYRLLREMGYCYSKLDGKRVYYHRKNKELIPVTIRDIKMAFCDFLETADRENIPLFVSRHDILNWVIDKQPIKVNGLFDCYLEDTLTLPERHQLKLKTDIGYSRNFETQLLLSKLQELDFKKTVDVVGNFCKDKDLYYKQIGSGQYLVFSHFKSKYHSGEVFDFWEATFASKKEIGREQAKDMVKIKFGFHLDEDFGLIRQFIN